MCVSACVQPCCRLALSLRPTLRAICFSLLWHPHHRFTGTVPVGQQSRRTSFATSLRTKRTRSGMRPTLLSGNAGLVVAEARKLIPQDIPPAKLAKRLAVHGRDSPLARFVLSEVTAIQAVMNGVRLSLEEVLAFQAGSRSVSPTVSACLRSLLAGAVPAGWPDVSRGGSTKENLR